MACETDFIDCNNDELGWEQLFRLLIAELPSGQPAVRVCDSGGGGGATALPIGNFVFVNPLGNDGTGAREDFHLPFLTLNGAKNSALAGDTIFVYGGTYNEANTLHKGGVKWHFIGQPVLNLSAPIVWTDSGAFGQQFIEIEGNAIVNHIGLGSVLDVVNTNTVVNVTFKSVTSLAYASLRLQNGSGIININGRIECTLTNHTIYLDGNASFTINAEEIFNSATSGITSCIYVKNNANIFTGLTVINSRLVQCDALFSAIRLDYGANTGTVVVNVSDKVHWTNLLGGTYPQTNNAVIVMGGNLEVNGNIDGGNGHAIQMSTATHDKSLTHNGNATNNGNLPLVGHGQFDIAFWLSNKATIKLNGIYSSSNPDTVTHGGTTSKLTVDGRVENSSTDVGTTTGVILENSAGTTIFESCVIVMDLGAGTPECVGSLVASNIKIFHSLGSNANANVNITNQITGTSLIVDTDFE